MQELDIWSLKREYPVPLNIGQNQKLNNLFCNFHLFHSLPCKFYQSKSISLILFRNTDTY